MITLMNTTMFLLHKKVGHKESFSGLHALLITNSYGRILSTAIIYLCANAGK